MDEDANVSGWFALSSNKRAKRLASQERRRAPWFPACLVLCVLAMTGCNERASETQCDQAYDHLIDVRIGDEPDIVKTIKRGTLEKNRTAFLSECVDRMPKSALKCWMAAESIDAMEKCESR